MPRERSAEITDVGMPGDILSSSAENYAAIEGPPQEKYYRWMLMKENLRR